MFQEVTLHYYVSFLVELNNICLSFMLLLCSVLYFFWVKVISYFENEKMVLYRILTKSPISVFMYLRLLIEQSNIMLFWDCYWAPFSFELLDVQVARHLILAGHDVHVVTGAPDYVYTTEIQSPRLFLRKVCFSLLSLLQCS